MSCGSSLAKANLRKNNEMSVFFWEEALRMNKKMPCNWQKKTQVNKMLLFRRRVQVDGPLRFGSDLPDLKHLGQQM